MKHVISSQNIESQDEVQFAVAPPSSCPFCGHLKEASVFSGHHILRYKKRELSTYLSAIIFVPVFCGNCEKVFVAEYQTARYAGNGSEKALDCEHVFPSYHAKAEHPSRIIALSPRYEKIYAEALYAEECELFEICGMGYRKALEFLVKDFAIKTHPGDQADIENSMLGQCIAKYIDNPKIKTLAKASAWIGNDKTHYIPRIPSYDIDELKAFLGAIEAYINAELEYLAAQSLVTNGT